MIDYRSILAESATKKSVIFTYMRGNPPTIGHGLLIKAVLSLAKRHNADHFIYVSHSQDSKKNPLNQNTKLSFLRAAFREANFVGSTPQMPTFIQAATHLNKTYTDLIMVAGSDRVLEFKKKLDQYNNNLFNYNSILVVSAGERDPDADGAAGMSASKMRDVAAKNDFSSFKKGVPETLSPIVVRRMFDDVRAGMQIKENWNDIRERYINEEIFLIGDIAILNEKEVTIIHRGANYVIVEDENGKSTTTWLKSLISTEKINENMKSKYADQIQIARIIGTSIGFVDADRLTDPVEIINKTLALTMSMKLNSPAIVSLTRMLDIAREVGIKFNETLAAAIVSPEDERILNPDDAKTGDLYGKIGTDPNEFEARRKIMYSVHEKYDDEEMTDKELDDIMSELDDDDIIEYAYEDDDFEIVDEETDETIEIDFDTTALNEVMSRAARLRAKAKMIKGKAQRRRGAKIALKKRASGDVIARRSRRAAIKVLKMRIAKKPVSQMSPGEKERVERRLSVMKGTINKLAIRLIPKVRKIEKDRLGKK